MSAFDGHGQTQCNISSTQTVFRMFIKERYNLLVFNLHHMVKLQLTGRGSTATTQPN